MTGFLLIKLFHGGERKFSRRYENLIDEGRLRTEQGIFEKDTLPKFDIIR